MAHTNSYKEMFKQQVEEWDKLVESKLENINSNLDKREKEMEDYVDFCKCMERVELMKIRKRKIRSILND